MRTRELDREDQQHTSQLPEAPAASGGTPEADALRRRAQRLLDLGDETISQALSQNSAEFLSQNRQRGGE